jgi:hypothetical protein
LQTLAAIDGGAKYLVGGVAIDPGGADDRGAQLRLVGTQQRRSVLNTRCSSRSASKPRRVRARASLPR